MTPQTDDQAPGMRRTQWAGFIGGALVFLLILFLPAPGGLSLIGWRAAAVAALMAVWWITEAIPITATALIPLVFFPALGVLVTGCAAAFDSQCGYTAIRRDAVERLDLGQVYPRYGYPNDLLIQLARSGARVRSVPVRAIYAPGTSKMKMREVVRPLCGILWRGMARRMRIA